MSEMVEKAAALADEEAAKARAKLPYFHRELSAEDQALLTKNQPKRIETANAAQQATTVGLNATAGSVTEVKLSTASAWNAAQSWEERDASVACQDMLRDALKAQGSFPALHSHGITVTGIDEDISGCGSVTHVRGKARYMYEMTFTVLFEFTPQVQASSAGQPANSKPFKGKLKVEEVSNDQSNEDMDLSMTWNGKSPPGAQLAASRKAILGEHMRAALRAALTTFETAFREL